MAARSKSKSRRASPKHSPGRSVFTSRSGPTTREIEPRSRDERVDVGDVRPAGYIRPTPSSIRFSKASNSIASTVSGPSAYSRVSTRAPPSTSTKNESSSTLPRVTMSAPGSAMISVMAPTSATGIHGDRSSNSGQDAIPRRHSSRSASDLGTRGSARRAKVSSSARRSSSSAAAASGRACATARRHARAALRGTAEEVSEEVLDTWENLGFLGEIIRGLDDAEESSSATTAATACDVLDRGGVDAGGAARGAFEREALVAIASSSSSSSHDILRPVGSFESADFGAPSRHLRRRGEVDDRVRRSSGDAERGAC